MKLYSLFLLVPLAFATQDDRTRIFITDSDSWEMSGGFGAGGVSSVGAGAGRITGGSRPQTVEIMKTFREKCPDLTITMDKEKAQYVVLFDREGGKDNIFGRDSKIAVFKNGGDLIYTGSTRTVGSSVANACKALKKGIAARD